MVLRSEKGIGLVEIVIAMLIFAIGITAAIRILPVSNRATTRSKNLTTATNLAQQKIEELMGIPYSDAQLSAGTYNDQDNPIERIYTRTWTVTDDDPIESMKTVTVTVSYLSGSKDNSVELSTYITSKR